MTTADTIPAPPGHRLDEIDEQVLRMFARVRGGLAAATAAFLECNRDAARTLVADDQLIDSLQASIEELVQRRLAELLPLGDADVWRLVSILLITPELERSGDLVEHIALRTPQGLARVITARARGLIEEMSRVGVELWRLAADAYAEHDLDAPERLRVLDDELDDLHVDLSAELAQAAISNAVAIEMGLVARFYERLGDHAVNVTKRVRDLGHPPAVEVGVRGAAG
jgi:phosphate transport system protein